MCDELILSLESPAKSNVTPFQPVAIRKREPQLSDEELVRIRRKLSEHETITSGCSLARKLLLGG